MEWSQDLLIFHVPRMSKPACKHALNMSQHFDLLPNKVCVLEQNTLRAAGKSLGQRQKNHGASISYSPLKLA